MYYLLFKIETSVSWMNSMKGFHSSIFEHFCTADKMLFGNVLGPHFCFELEQICPSSPTTRISSLRRKKKSSDHATAGSFETLSRCVKWGEKKKKLSMGLICSVELWMDHFLRTNLYRGTTHVQTSKNKRKPWTFRLRGTNWLPLEVRNTHSLLSGTSGPHLKYPGRPLSGPENEPAAWGELWQIGHFLKFTSADSLNSCLAQFLLMCLIF